MLGHFLCNRWLELTTGFPAPFSLQLDVTLASAGPVILAAMAFVAVPAAVLTKGPVGGGPVDAGPVAGGPFGAGRVRGGPVAGRPVGGGPFGGRGQAAEGRRRLGGHQVSTLGHCRYHSK